MEILEGNCEALSSDNVIILHCIDTSDRLRFELKAFSSLRLLTVAGHLSLMTALNERRKAMFLFDDNLDLVDGRTSPLVIKVLSSCVVEVEEGQSIVLICKFVIVENQSVVAVSSSVAPRSASSTKKPDNIPEIPRCEFSSLVLCNCMSSQPRNVIVSNEVNPACAHRSCSSSSSESETENYSPPKKGKKQESTHELFTERITLKGSSYHSHFQASLKVCKQKLIAKQHIELKLNPEPTNVKDENGVVVQAHLDGTWRPIGYIPGKKIPKVTMAIADQQITEIKLKGIDYNYNQNISAFSYVPHVLLTKKGR